MKHTCFFPFLWFTSIRGINWGSIALCQTFLSSKQKKCPTCSCANYRYVSANLRCSKGPRVDARTICWIRLSMIYMDIKWNIPCVLVCSIPTVTHASALFSFSLVLAKPTCSFKIHTLLACFIYESGSLLSFVLRNFFLDPFLISYTAAKANLVSIHWFIF